MLLSVLIPFYNAEEFIESSLESALNQDLPLLDFEILLMDDGSTDSSCEIIRRYTKDHEHVFFYKNPKKGVYSARNELLKLARGTYVYFLDSDDYIAKNALKYLLQMAFQSNLDLVAFKTKITSIVEPFQIASNLLKIEDAKLMSGAEFIATYRYMRQEVWWYLIRKELLNGHHLVFDEMPYCADVLFTLQLFLKAKKVGLIPEEIHRYIQTENSIIRSKNIEKMIGVLHCQVQMIKDVSRLIQEVDNDHSKGGLKYNLLKNLRFRRDHHLFIAVQRMIQAKLPYYEIKDILHNLRTYNAYPLKTYRGKECESLKLRLMVFIINNQLLLRPAISVYRFLNR